MAEHLTSYILCYILSFSYIFLILSFNTLYNPLKSHLFQENGNTHVCSYLINSSTTSEIKRKLFQMLSKAG